MTPWLYWPPIRERRENRIRGPHGARNVRGRPTLAGAMAWHKRQTGWGLGQPEPFIKETKESLPKTN
jgi:hypothetical protein